MNGQGGGFRKAYRLRQLTFPAEAQGDEHASATAVRSFSAGRSHILALSDTDTIWSWSDADEPAVSIEFAGLHVDQVSHAPGHQQPASAKNRVRQVVAGWSRSSAYVHGVGIVVWDIAQVTDPNAEHPVQVEHAQLPRTGYRRVKNPSGESEYDKALGAEVGSVLNYIILEHFVVFNTDLGKVFCGRFGDNNTVETMLELSQLRTEEVVQFDVQGSFRRFAIFRNGEVITANQDYLEACWATRHSRTPNLEQADIQGLTRVPALQHRDIIQVAFGDYHYLALHSSGKVTTYGAEVSACGALGLSDGTKDGGYARGVVYDRRTRRGQLLPHAYTYGRRVWFDGRKFDWLDYLLCGGTNPAESAERRELFKTDRDVQAEVSEWIEQETRAWDEMEEQEDEVGPYFAMGVSAAGWHSGALVLVNQDFAGREPVYDWRGVEFPRLKLADGTEMPGQKEFDKWRYGRPDWQLDFEPEIF
jgi:SCF-associated factor 1